MEDSPISDSEMRDALAAFLRKKNACSEDDYAKLSGVQKALEEEAKVDSHKKPSK